jgi:signal transduction histidine kinase/ligand-binding sensor domain-containing protein
VNSRLAFRYAAFLGGLACTPAVAGAQQGAGGSYVLDQWNTENGLPQNTVRAIVQTPDGYLWLATFGGLVRFDGVSFTSFPASRNPGIRSDRDQALCIAPDSTLWIGTEDGLVRLAHGKFQSFSVADGLPPGSIAALACDRSGAVWAAMDTRGVVRWQGGHATVFTSATTLRGGGVSDVKVDGADHLWFGLGGGRLGRIHAGDATLVVQEADLPAPDVIDIMGPGRAPGTTLFQTRTGAMVVDSANRVLQRVDVPVAVRGLTPVGVVQSADSGWWISTIHGGAVYLATHGAPTSYALPSGAADYHVRSLLVDRAGVSWVGTETDGLLRLRPRIFTVVSRAEGLASDLPMGISGDTDGRVYVGSNCDGLTVFDHGRPTVWNRRQPWPDIQGCIWSVLSAPDSTVWLGIFGGGLLQWRPSGIRRFTSPGNGPDGVVLSLMRDHAGHLWEGTMNAGVARWDGDRFVAWDSTRGLPSNDVRTVIETRDHTVWAGTGNGAARLVGERFTAFGAADGLPKGQIRAIYEDADSTLWFGSYGGGMARYKHGRFTAITSAKGLVEDVASAIVEDDYGNLWTSGNRGISRVARRELNEFADGTIPAVHAVLYGRADGLLIAETNGGFSPEAWKAPDGRIWFPTLKGVAIVDPARVTTSGGPPGVLIEQVLVDGVARDTTRRLVLTADSRNLEIGYTGLSSAAPEQILFRYRLSGGDTSWVNVGTRRRAYFTRLPGGTYTFTVTAANRDGIWNPVGATLTFAVQPPLAQTWWFRLIVAALVLGAVTWAVRARIARLREQAGTQREFARRVLQGQEQERQRIAAELHDSVGQSLLVMKNRAELGLRGSDLTAAVREQLSLISSVASETLTETRAIAHNLRPYQLDRLGLAAAVRTTVERAAEGSGIRFVVDADGVDGLLKPDAEISLYRIVQEALNNVLKHSAAKEAHVALHAANGAVRLVVSDDGRGADGAAGFGLSGIAQRVQLLGGTHEFHSQPGAGTTLVVSVPTATER